MKVFIAMLISTLAVAAQGSSYVEPAWPVVVGHATYPQIQWSPASWPVTSLYNGYTGVRYGGRKTTVEPNVAKVNPWGCPTSVVPAYDYGYNNYLGVVPTNGKYIAPVVSGLVHEAPLVGYGANSKLSVAGYGY